MKHLTAPSGLFFDRNVKTFFAILVLLFVFSPRALFAASSLLHVSGNQIVNAAGCTVRLKGVNLSGLEYSPTGDGGTGRPTTVVNGVTMTDYVALATEAISVWHCNVVRLCLNQDYWFGCSNSNGTPNQTAYKTMIQAVVNYCSANNAYVDLDLHWSGTSGTATAPCGSGWGGSTAQQTMPDMNAVTFWSSVGSAYANNSAVIFDLYNEPHDITWSIWRDGGSAGSYNTPGMQALATAVRNAGANNIVVIGGLNWSFDLRGVASGSTSCTGGTNCSLTDGSGNGVLYVSHEYSSKGFPAGGTEWDNEITVASTTHPIMVEEFGATSSDGASWDNTTLNWINGTNNKSYVYSAIGWAFSSDVGPTMLTSFAGYPTTSYHGAPVSTWLFNLNQTPTPNCGGNTPTFTFTPTKTNTPTFTNTPTNSPTKTNSPTSTFTSTFSNTATATRTNTATSTGTATFTSTNSPTKTNSPTSTSTPTATATRTSTNTSTFTSTPTNTQVNTATLTSTATSTATSTRSNTPANTNTYTSTPTFTRTFTSTNTATPTNTFVNTATATATASSTFTATKTATPTNTGSSTFTSTRSNTPTNTSTFTPTTTNTPANTPTGTSSPTSVPTQPLLHVTQGPVPPSSAAVYGGTTNVPVLQININNVSNAPTTLTSLKLTASGTGNDATDIQSIKVYLDSNGNGVVDGGDILMGSGTYASDNGTSVITLTSGNVLPAFGNGDLLVTYDISPVAPNGASYQAAIVSNNDLTGLDGTYGLPVLFTGMPQTGATISVTDVTPTPTRTFTSTATATFSSTGTLSPTKTFTSTGTSTFTATATSTPTKTNTSTFTNTPTATSTPTGTFTFTATSTGTLSPTQTSTSTGTSTFSRTPTASATNSPTFTFTATATFTNTPTKTNTPTVTLTRTFTFTPTASFTPTPTSTNTPLPVIKPVLYPNPVTGGDVTLNPGLQAVSDVTVALFTSNFRRVNVESFPQVPAGATVQVILTDRTGKPLANGLYYVVVQTNQGRSILKLMILR